MRTVQKYDLSKCTSSAYGAFTAPPRVGLANQTIIPLKFCNRKWILKNAAQCCMMARVEYTLHREAVSSPSSFGTLEVILFVTFLKTVPMEVDILCSISSSSDAPVCLRYWARDHHGRWEESIQALCQTLDVTLRQLLDTVLESSLAYACKTRCPVCKAPMSARTRAEFEDVLLSIKSRRVACQRASCQLAERPLDPRATASFLRQRADFISDTLQKLLQEMHPVDYSQLGFIDAFYLYCVLLASEGNSFYNELPSSSIYSIPLAPTRLLADSVYARLRKGTILVPSLHSPISAFNVTFSTGLAITYDVNRVSWTMAEDRAGRSHVNLAIMLESIIRSGDAASLAELRQNLIAHECVGEVVEALAGIGITLDTSFESQILSAVHYCLRFIPVRAMEAVIGQVFSENIFRKALRSAESDTRGSVVSKALIKFVDGMFVSRSAPAVLTSAADGKLEISKSLMSQVFYEWFLQ